MDCLFIYPSFFLGFIEDPSVYTEEECVDVVTDGCLDKKKNVCMCVYVCMYVCVCVNVCKSSFISLAPDILTIYQKEKKKT